MVNGKKELYQLCRSSKLLRSFAEPRLYQAHFSRSKLAKVDIRTLIQHPRFEVLVNSLTIELIYWDLCEKWVPKRGLFGSAPPLRPCSCDELDGRLGRSLNGLINLKVLRLSCRLCSTTSNRRHGYLLTLQTRSLQQVRFRCGCSPMDKMGMEKVVENIAAPCMASVTALGWHNPATARFEEEFWGPLQENLQLLKNLSHFDFEGGALDTLFLRHCPITRLSSSELSIAAINYEDLKRLQGQLTHLSLHYHGGGSVDLFRAMAQDPSPFQNLQHIGTFPLQSSTCSERSKELHTILSQFVTLGGLTSIDAWFGHPRCMPCKEYTQIFRTGLTQISELFPHLRRVFLHSGRLTDTWILANKWEHRGQDITITNFDLVSDIEPPIWDVYLHP